MSTNRKLEKSSKRSEGRWWLLIKYYRNLVSTAKDKCRAPRVPEIWLETEGLVDRGEVTYVFYVAWQFTDKESLPKRRISITLPNDYSTMPLQELKEMVDTVLNDSWTDQFQITQYWADYCEVKDLVMAAIEQDCQSFGGCEMCINRKFEKLNKRLEGKNIGLNFFGSPYNYQFNISHLINENERVKYGIYYEDDGRFTSNIKCDKRIPWEGETLKSLVGKVVDNELELTITTDKDTYVVTFGEMSSSTKVTIEFTESRKIFK